MLRRVADFLKAVFHPLPVFYVSACDGRHTDNRVHGSAYLMAHSGEKILFGSVGILRIDQRILPLLTDRQLKDLKSFLLSKKDRCLIEMAITFAEYMPVVYPSDVVREIYGNLLEPMYLVYPLLLNRTQDADETIVHMIEMMETALDVREAKMFCQGFLKLLKFVQSDIEKIGKELQE